MLAALVRRHALLRLYQHRRLFFATSSAGAALGNAPCPNPHFMVKYLVNSCGFSAAEATKVSKSLAHLQSTEKLDAVVTFMRSQGIDGANLRRMIAYRPRFLCWDVEKNLAPKFQFLRGVGLSESSLVEVVVANPTIISYNAQRSLLPKLKMWETLFGSKELLFMNLKKRRWFVGNSIERVVRPNLNFLRDECGIPEERVSLLLRMNPTFITQNPDSLRELVLRADELGVPRQSRMFLWTLNVLHMVCKEKFESQIKLMKSLGWLDSEISTAIKKQPSFIGVSQEMLKRKMEFLVKEVGWTPSYVANNPVVLLFSLDKRVIPRFRAMKVLRLKGLLTGERSLLPIFLMSNENFMKKLVHPYKEKAPELLDLVCKL